MWGNEYLARNVCTVQVCTDRFIQYSLSLNTSLVALYYMETRTAGQKCVVKVKWCWRFSSASYDDMSGYFGVDVFLLDFYSIKWTMQCFSFAAMYNHQ
jgi:hypothetical protein